MGNALSQLITSLQNHPVVEYGKILAQATITPHDIQSHCFFSAQYYTRNLIFADDSFELIVLCWKGLQQTPIHDHNNSEGWLKTIKGGVVETIYEWDKKNKRANLQKVISEEELGPGGTSHVNDDIGVHSICNPNESETVTLHLYSPRIIKCHYIDRKSTSIKEKILGFHSINGKLVGHP